MDLGKLSELSQRRKCLTCGAVFEEIPATKERGVITALQQFADHITIHQPTPEQWAHAYDLIQEAKEKKKDI